VFQKGGSFLRSLLVFPQRLFPYLFYIFQKAGEKHHRNSTALSRSFPQPTALVACLASPASIPDMQTQDSALLISSDMIMQGSCKHLLHMHTN
jgi:hypothetical protein